MSDQSLPAPTSLKAFVLSPIDEGEFDELYLSVIRPALESVGVDVSRADELDLQNIMAAVIQGIANSDLVVAEITTRNPNVMYELGIAHALGRPVVIVTQDIEQVPFDLRAYRVVKYSSHFASIGSLTKALQDVVAAIRAGTLSYSSPVADFAREEASQIVVGSEPILEQVESDVPFGLVDYLASVEESMEVLNQGTLAVAQASETIGARMQDRTAELEASSKSTAPGQNVRMLTILRKSSTDMDEFAGDLLVYETLLTEIVPQIADSLVGLAGLAPITDQNDRQSAAEFVETVSGMRQTLHEASESLGGFRDSIAGLRDMKMSRDLTRSSGAAVRRMDAIVDQLSSFEADLGRGVAILSDRLTEGMADGGSESMAGGN